MRQRRGLIFVIIVAVIVMFFGLQSANASIGNLQVYKGSAQIVRSGQSNTGNTGTPIKLHDTIKIAQDSTVAIVLKDSSVIRLEAGTEAEVDDLAYEGTKIKSAVFKLKYGRLWSRVAPIEPGGQFEVETPTSVAAVAGTSYNSTYKSDITGYYVYHHRIKVALVSDKNKTETVDEGQLLRMHDDTLIQDFADGGQTPPNDFFDEWIRFNQAEDDKICRDHPETPGCGEESASPSPIANILPSDFGSTPGSFTPTLSPTPSSNPFGIHLPQPTKTPTPKSQPKGPPPPPPPPPPPAPTKTLTSVTLSSSRTNLNYGETATLKVTAKYSDSSTSDVTGQVSWSQSPVLGTISGTTFTATKVGTTALKATFGSISSNSVSLVIDHTLSSLSLSCTSIDRQTSTAQCAAKAIYSDRAIVDVTKSTNWSIQEPKYLATIKAGSFSLGDSPYTTYTILGSYGGKDAKTTTGPPNS